MGRINLGRVVGGGLLAGLVLNLIDFVLNGVLLKEQWGAAMTALGKPADMDTGMIMYFVLCDFLLGVAMVWVYAAIRPRFGAGAKTAVIAGLATWVILPLSFTITSWGMGIFPRSILLTTLLVGAVAFPLAAVAGAALYKEEGAGAGSMSPPSMAGAAR